MGLEYSLNSYLTSACPWFIFQEVETDDGIKIILLSDRRDDSQINVIYEYLLNHKYGFVGYNEFHFIFDEILNQVEEDI